MMSAFRGYDRKYQLCVRLTGSIIVSRYITRFDRHHTLRQKFVYSPFMNLRLRRSYLNNCTSRSRRFEIKARFFTSVVIEPWKRDEITSQLDFVQRGLNVARHPDVAFAPVTLFAARLKTIAHQDDEHNSLAGSARDRHVIKRRSDVDGFHADRALWRH